MPSHIPPPSKPAEKPPNVQLAERSDEQDIFKLLKVLAMENAIFNVNDDLVMDSIQRATKREGGIIGIIKENGEVVASIGIFLERLWYTSDWYISEYWNFVHPDHRRKPYFRDLMSFAKWINENMGITLCMGIMSTTRTVAKEEILNRKMTRIGALFMNGFNPEADARLREMA